jgi:hypothetical protein
LAGSRRTAARWRGSGSAGLRLSLRRLRRSKRDRLYHGLREW